MRLGWVLGAAGGFPEHEHNDTSIAFGYQHGVAGSVLLGFILTAGGSAVRRVLERVDPRLQVCRCTVAG